MKKIPGIWVAGLVAAGLLIGLTVNGCGDAVTEQTTKSLSSLAINPVIATIEVGANRTFSCIANYSDGTVAVVKPVWTFTGTCGVVAAVGYSGRFTASLEGAGVLHAEYLAQLASAEITVTTNEAAAGLTTIEVTPVTYKGRQLGSVTFGAQGVNASGEAVAINPTWRSSNSLVGTLTFEGTTATLEVKGQGTTTISCLTGGVTGSASVTIEGYVVEITVESDTYVDQSDPATTHESDAALKAGYVNATDRRYETYLRFRLTGGVLPTGASLEAAALMLYPSVAGSSTLQIKKLNSAFTAATTWETRPPTGTFLMSGNFTAGSYNQIGNDALLVLAREWYAGTPPNYGVAVIQEGTVDGTVVILSKEDGTYPPRLRLEYRR